MSFIQREEHPYLRLFRSVVSAAKELNASDIHIEPSHEGIDIRFRLYGEMLPSHSKIPARLKDGFIRELKAFSGLNVGLRSEPQDGRVRFPDHRLVLRVNSIPTIFGEKLCFRLLDQSKTFDFSKMGHHPKVIDIFNQIKTLESGLILLSGITGSGKTSTLYSILESLPKNKLQIISIEDPVEYEIIGAQQIQVTKKLSFAQSLRSVLRQDPDVIFIGEIRDPETAKLAIQACETGHLVFSSIHAHSLKGIRQRLYGLGIETPLLDEHLKVASYQKLILKICRLCSSGCLNGTRSRGRGCDSCESGIQGLVPISETFSAIESIESVSLMESIEYHVANGAIDSLEARCA